MHPLDPLAVAQSLIRIDTTNPPGRERAAIEHLAAALREAGLDSAVLAMDPERPNLVVRLEGEGTAPPLLLHGHVDVVPADPAEWARDPFGGVAVDGELWGRGALDMKGGVAMLAAALTRLAASGERSAGDVILLVMSDEEAGSRVGARYVVDEHPGLLDGVRHAIGEGGGFTSWLGGRPFYPVAVTEKKRCLLRAVCRGAAGHASAISRDPAMAHVGALLTRLTGERLPVRVTAPAELMLRELAAGLGRPELLGLLDPERTDAVLREAGGELDGFEALLRNTVAPTMLRGAAVPNVHPAEVAVTLDARLVPGQEVQGVMAELELLGGDVAEFHLVEEEPPTLAGEDLDLLPLIREVLGEADPGAVAVPALITGFTDARHFARLGIQNYGFLPMRLPADRGMQLMHSADERIPVSELEFGAACLHELLRRYGRQAAL
jgi:acetylornithine deacetylase/succinyl-diaminopimelate desuccinylase-like protein